MTGTLMGDAADCKRWDLARRRQPFPQMVCWMNCRHVVVILLLGAAISVSAQSGSFVRINQLGYQIRDVKNAMAFGAQPVAAAFLVTDADNGATVWRGETKPITDVYWGQFHYHAQCDFSGLLKSGHYILHIGAAQSARFAIADDVYAALPDELLEFMREQRCGYNPFLDQTCHQLDGRTAYGPLTNGTFVDCTGGWHDAGDLLKYLLTSGNATAQMLMAWRLAGNSQIFHDSVQASGRPGTNGVPDILDEARWGLQWMLKLHPAPDQLYHQVADDRDHAGWRLPKDDYADYGWGNGKDRVVYFADGKPQGLKNYKSESTGIANLAGRYAAAMALADLVFKERDPAFARTCVQAGIEVYRMGRTNEGVQQGNSYSAPYRYAETTWTDDMEWGAAALYSATGESNYLADAKHYAALAGSESWMGREQTGHYQYYPFMNLGHFMLFEFADPALQRVLAGYYREGIERCIAAGGKNPYGVGVPFIWCSNNLLAALVTQCALYERMTGDHRYHEFMCQQRDWLLGRNPWGASMFTGIPADGIYPHHPHLMTTQLTGRSVRGALVDGPVYERIFKTLKGVSAPANDPFAPFQSELAVYHDDLHDYSTNEPTMDGTASAILMWALLCAAN
jgi:endoglucanase